MDVTLLFESRSFLRSDYVRHNILKERVVFKHSTWETEYMTVPPAA
jgi:hypothetical protein